MIKKCRRSLSAPYLKKAGKPCCRLSSVFQTLSNIIQMHSLTRFRYTLLYIGKKRSEKHDVHIFSLLPALSERPSLLSLPAPFLFSSFHPILSALPSAVLVLFLLPFPSRKIQQKCQTHIYKSCRLSYCIVNYGL